MEMAKIPLLALLSLLLCYAMVTDWRARIIDNWLNLLIAALAVPWWFSTHQLPWPDMAIHVAIAAVVFMIFAGMFAIGAMGGGDVKLIGALALWFPLSKVMDMLMVMAILGGVLTLVMMLLHKRSGAPGKVEVPYGIAIAIAGLWTIFQTIS